MLFLQSFGNEHFDGPARQLVPTVPEQALDFAIDEHDRALTVHHHQTARGRLDRTAKQFLGASFFRRGRVRPSAAPAGVD